MPAHRHTISPIDQDSSSRGGPPHRGAWTLWVIVLGALGLPAAAGHAQDRVGLRSPRQVPPAQAEEEEEEEEESPGRFFLYTELVASAFWSPEGVIGLPPGDTSEDHFEFSPRPPGNYVGVDLVGTFTSASGVNRSVLPPWLPLSAIDLHPRLVYDRMEDDDWSAVKFAPQDFWARFNPGNVDRLSLRVGEFVIPYGVNPIRAPRQGFLLPVEATDLGLKWDWGVDLKGPIGEHEYEIATTIGSGEALHSPHLFEDSRRRTWLLTGRIGTPTYWDFQYGLSALYGKLATIRGPTQISEEAISRWRVGLDTTWKYGTYLMSGAQVTFGQDGFLDDEQYVAITGGKTANVLGGRAWVDWVVPRVQDLRLAAQIETVVRDLDTSDSDDTTLIFELGWSFSTTSRFLLDWRQEINKSMGNENNALYLTFVVYG